MVKFFLVISSIFTLLLIGYFLGVTFPIHVLKGFDTGHKVELLGVIGTFSAIFVALFKEEIRYLLRSPKIVVNLPGSGFSETTSGGESSDNIQAVSYQSILSIKNLGKIPSTETEALLESIEYKSNQNTSLIEVNIPQNTIIPWSESLQKKNLVPNAAHKITIMEIRKTDSIPDTSSIQATLVIAGITIPEQYMPQNGDKAKWICKFLICSNTGIHTRFTIEIEWNGKWKQRKTEMDNVLSLKLNNDKN